MSVLDDIAAERRRLIKDEGWTPEHDDAMPNGQFSRAAACYALVNAKNLTSDHAICTFWPWSDRWLKPRDARANLIHAAALLVAEIERLDRATTQSCLFDAEAYDVYS